MTVVLKSALVALVTGVREYLTARGVTANVVLGAREAAQQANQGTGRANRVVFLPYDGEDAGRLVQPQQPGPRAIYDADDILVGHVRALRTWERRMSVLVWAADTTDPGNEGKQIQATDTLFEWTVRGVHYAQGPGGERLGLANIEWGQVKRVHAQGAGASERPFGRELIAAFTFRHPVFDIPTEQAFPEEAVINRSPAA